MNRTGEVRLYACSLVGNGTFTVDRLFDLNCYRSVDSLRLSLILRDWVRLRAWFKLGPVLLIVVSLSGMFCLARM
jgi:hypothetical protein